MSYLCHVSLDSLWINLLGHGTCSFSIFRRLLPFFNPLPYSSNDFRVLLTAKQQNRLTYHLRTKNKVGETGFTFAKTWPCKPFWSRQHPFASCLPTTKGLWSMAGLADAILIHGKNIQGKLIQALLGRSWKWIYAYVHTNKISPRWRRQNKRENEEIRPCNQSLEHPPSPRFTGRSCWGLPPIPQQVHDSCSPSPTSPLQT